MSPYGDFGPDRESVKYLSKRACQKALGPSIFKIIQNSKKKSRTRHVVKHTTAIKEY